jgi:hypothetical protein
MELGYGILDPGRKVFFLDSPGIVFQMHVNIIAVAAVVTDVYMVYRTRDSITLSEIELPQASFRLYQFRKLHIFQDCHITNVILPE